MAKKEALVGGFVGINDAAAEVERICNAYHGLDIDCTVLLTHIGFEEDKQLAAQLDPSLGVDIIIGGHSHTYLEQPEEVNGILIAQAGTGTDQIGRFDLEIDMDSNHVHSFAWKSIPITDEHCPRDTALEAILNPYKQEAEKKYSRVVTRLKRQLTHPSWYQETELGGFLADILRESLRLDMMLVGSGSIRVTELGPIILFSNLTECLPYDDSGLPDQLVQVVILPGIPFRIHQEANSVLKGHVLKLWISELVLQCVGHNTQPHFPQLGYCCFGQHHLFPFRNTQPHG